MTHDEHRDRHILLHREFDELLADYMTERAEWPSVPPTWPTTKPSRSSPRCSASGWTSGRKIVGFMADNLIDAEIERRTERGKRLAEKYPELKGKTFTEFADAMLQEMEIDFVTCCEMYDALNPKEGG